MSRFGRNKEGKVMYNSSFNESSVKDKQEISREDLINSAVVVLKRYNGRINLDEDIIKLQGKLTHC